MKKHLGSGECPGCFRFTKIMLPALASAWLLLTSCSFMQSREVTISPASASEKERYYQDEGEFRFAPGAFARAGSLPRQKRTARAQYGGESETRWLHRASPSSGQESASPHDGEDGRGGGAED